MQRLLFSFLSLLNLSVQIVVFKRISKGMVDPAMMEINLEPGWGWGGDRVGRGGEGGGL